MQPITQLLRLSLLAPLGLGSPLLAQGFVDVTQAAGLDYLQAGPGATQASEHTAMTGGAAAGDIDGDGWVDLLVTRLDEPAILFRNLGRDGSGNHLGFLDDTSFVFRGRAPGKRSNGAAFGDVDGDGDLDLYVTSVWTRCYQLWINDGGRFVEEAAERGADLQTEYTHYGFSPAFGDFDGDGYLDLYVSEWGHFSSTHASHSRLLRNRGAAAPGHFEDVTDSAGVALEGGIGVYAYTPIFSDLDGDGHLDLAIASDFGTSRLFWNDGDGTFTDGTAAAGVGTDENGMGACVADLNGDGLLDWFVTAIYDPDQTCDTISCNWGYSGNRLFLNAGGRSFVDATDLGVRDGGWGWGAVALDCDHDGDQDLAMTNGIEFDFFPADDAFNDDPMKLWRNDGSRFTEVAVASGITDQRSGKGLLTLDFDRDGDLDLFVANNGAGPALYESVGAAGHWLQVRLKSDSPNRHGIGARVLLTRSPGEAPQVRELGASSHYLGQSEVLAHFGLGDEPQPVHRIEVLWPGGQVSVLQDVAVDRRLLVREP